MRHPRPTPTEPRPRRALLLALLAAAGTALTLSCSRAPGSERPGPGDPAARADAATRPDVRAMNAPPPPGLDAALAQVIPESDEKARLPFDEALRRLAETPPESAAAPEVADPAPVADASPAAPAAAAEALRLYAQGRVARLTGQPREAAAALQRAARLDPTSAPVWRELGEAHLQSGNRAFAAAAFNRALAIDPDDLQAVERVASIALDRRDHATSAHLLARLLQRRPETIDPALPFIAKSRFSRSAAALGYLRAAAEASLQAVDLPERFDAPTARESDLNALYRARGDTLRDAADSMLRLGLSARARDIYEQAAGLPTLAPSALNPRRVYAAMRAGDSNAAADILISQIRAARGRVDDSLLALIAHLAQHSERGPAALRAGIDRVESELAPSDRALAAGPLLRARAAAAPPREALELLRGRLVAAPADEDAVRSLMSRLRAEPDLAVVRETAALIDAAPLHERRYVQALARELDARRLQRRQAQRSENPADTEPPPPAPISAEVAAMPLDAVPTGTRALLGSRLLALENKPEEALAALDPIEPVGVQGAAAALARAPLLAALGRTEEAIAALRAIAPEPDTVRAAKGLALIQRGDDAAALETLAPLLEQPPSQPDAATDPERAELFFAVGQLRVRRGESDLARDAFESAIALDPAHEGAHLGLISLYAVNQPLADEARLIETIRRLREANPSSRGLRWLRAQESLARGQLDLAERDLIDLAEELPTQSDIVGTLTTLWLRTGSAPRAEGWLRAKLERFPDSSALTVALARAVTAQGRSAEAETILASRLERTPGDAEVSRTLEDLYRDELNQPQKADELAARRLRNAPVSPESLIEQADLAWRGQRFSEASAYLAQMLERFPRAVIRGEPAARVANYIVQAGTEAIRDNRFAQHFVSLIGGLVDAAPSVSAEAHAVRLIIENRSGLIDTEPLLRALEQAVRQWPRRAEELIRRAADAAWNRGRTDRNFGIPEADARVVAAGRERSLRLIEQAPRLLDKLSPDLVLDWLDLAILTRQTNSFVEALNRARAEGILEGVLERMDGGINPRVQRARALADNAYRLAGILSFLGAEPASEEMLRTALKSDPRHHPSANDLGYRLLVADRDIDEAARLIEIAYQQEPDRASYVDSMGWARYKQGIIHDQPAPEGAPDAKATPGAVSLLSRALDLMTQANDADSRVAMPIIIDHLGDACWAAGDRETAARHWELAAQDADAILNADQEARKDDGARESGDERILGEAVRKELEAVLTSARAKSVAARAGNEPPVSKIHGPIR